MRAIRVACSGGRGPSAVVAGGCLRGVLARSGLAPDRHRRPAPWAGRRRRERRLGQRQQGNGATHGRSGHSWQQVAPPDTATLDFRDIEAIAADHAVALSIGPGNASRIYRTVDGGAHWQLTLRNTDGNAFYDCIAFFDHQRGLAMCVRWTGLSGCSRCRTAAGAGSPSRLTACHRPVGRGAASGQCVTTSDPRDALIATCGGAGPGSCTRATAAATGTRPALRCRAVRPPAYSRSSSAIRGMASPSAVTSRNPTRRRPQWR